MSFYNIREVSPFTLIEANDLHGAVEAFILNKRSMMYELARTNGEIAPIERCFRCSRYCLKRDLREGRCQLCSTYKSWLGRDTTFELNSSTLHETKIIEYFYDRFGKEVMHEGDTFINTTTKTKWILKDAVWRLTKEETKTESGKIINMLGQDATILIRGE